MSSNNPARRRYRVAVGDPGANEVFTQAGGRKPNARAFLASSAAAMIRRGSDVLVQLVIAAIATEPFGMIACAGDTRSCGRRGPAREVSTALRSISMTSV